MQNIHPTNASRVLPASGPPEHLVVLLHGYGASGSDLIGLGDYWSSKLPKVAFYAPNAPHPCDDNPFGYQWFSMAGWPQADLADRVQETLPAVKTLVENESKNLGINDLSRVALLGFSQGAILSLCSGIYGIRGLKGVMGYSGGFKHSKHLKPVNNPEVFLYHGEDDEVVPPEFSTVAAQHLESLKIKPELHMEANLGHEISIAGLEKGLAFLKQIFKI